MASTKSFKLLILGVFCTILAAWVVIGLVNPPIGSSASELTDPSAQASGLYQDDRFVGSETCRACHENQFNDVSRTSHGKLEGLSDWKNKVVGCESCHGPGKEHVEAGGDKTKITNLAGLDPKAIAETCLTCHAGKENHNNFRRGEHWRNNVGCTDCHSAHGASFGPHTPGSATYLADGSAQRPTLATRKMLKKSDPQLCIGCHSDVKSQFSKPFRHKVLEGTMTCSDCHNPHGGFESKQTKLAVGTDAACVKCHTNKQGPFVYEHGPVKTEGCSACHIPHGTSNPKMLKRAQVRQLCFECHTGISEELAPQAASRHNQAQLRYQQCTICHSAIHGSNSHPAFYR